MSPMTLSQYNCRSIIEDKTNVEGGYVNNKKDSGGETNHGITAALANDYKDKLEKHFNWNGKMINLTKEMAFWLYETHFWNRINGDELLKRHPLIADKIFDMAINMGVTQAVIYLQYILNANNNLAKLYPDLVVDGGLGPNTLKALDAFIRIRKVEGIHRLLCTLLCEQGHHYLDLTRRRVKDEEFYYGWAGRVTRDVGIYSRLLGFFEWAALQLDC